MKIIKTLLQHHKAPDDFNIYMRHEFDNNTFVAIYQLKAVPLIDLGQPFRIGARYMESQNIWVEYGSFQEGGVLVDGHSYYADEEGKAWFNFHQLIAEIMLGEAGVYVVNGDVELIY